MKKIVTIIAILSLFTSQVYAAHSPTKAITSIPTITPSTTPTPTGGNILQEINDLKDRIASKVAQLNLVTKKGIIGKVIDVGPTQLTVQDQLGNNQFVDVDELTQFSSPSAKNSFGISDITKNSTVGILGQYNKDSKRILARFVDVLILPQVISGAVINIDNINYEITVITPTLTQYTIDIQDITKTISYSKENGIERSGFSKIKAGERILIIGFPDATKPSHVLASRIIRFPELKVNPAIPADKLPSIQSLSPTPLSGNNTTP